MTSPNQAALQVNYRRKAIVTQDHFEKRLLRNEKVLIERGGLTEAEANAAMRLPDPKSKDRPAEWLRSELASLRVHQRTVGAAPVRRGKAMSPVLIADLTLSMFETLDGIPHSLILLLEEVLKADKHRSEEARSYSVAYRQAARLEAEARTHGRTIGVRKLADEVGVNASTVSRWQKTPEYHAEVEGWFVTLNVSPQV